MRILPITLSAALLLASAACGGGQPSTQANGPLTGNWQLNLVQNYPAPQAQLSASGFLVESSDRLTGSVVGPTIASSNGSHNCGGVGPVTGTISGQNITFALSPGGTVFNFTGTISSDNASMSGSYQATGGACFVQAGTTGTWTATLIPPLNGNFTGTLSNSTYMGLLTGQSPVPTIAVSGTITQSTNAGSGAAGLTGTITATGYPCFATASLTGTISGQNVFLSVFGYDGQQIGVLGSTTTPAVASSTPSGTSTGAQITGTLSLGETTSTTVVGPCPPLNGGSGTLIGDSSNATLTIQ